MNRRFAQTRCAFYLHSLDELDADPARTLILTAETRRVNPNAGAAPIFRTRRDATSPWACTPPPGAGAPRRQQRQRRHPAQCGCVAGEVRHHVPHDQRLRLFLKESELEKRGWRRAELNRWVDAQGDEGRAVYEGEMVQCADHRAQRTWL